jgi:predicted nucleic acid-binding protein
MKSGSLLIDTNVLLDIFTDNSNWADWSIAQIEKYQRIANLKINSIIYSELSIGFARIEELENSLYAAGIKMVDIPRESLFLAGKAFLKYRKQNKGTKSITLPDFFIGAHAAVEQIPVLTRDPKRMKHYFPSLKVVSP